MTASELEYELRIRPGASWRRVDWRALWRYRDLLLLLVRRDFVAKYSQTLLGPLWFILQPLVTTALFSLVFAGVAKISTDNSPALLFYLCGLLPWTFFANTFNSCAQTLTANAGIFGKVYFPRLIVPLSVAVSNLFAVAVHLVLIVCVYSVFFVLGEHGGASPRWTLCLLPLILMQVAALAIGAGLLMSAMTTKYRDFSHVSGLLINIWFYATPVLFPLSIVPPHLRSIAVLNPMSFIEEASRRIMLGGGVVEPIHAIISIGVTVVVLVSGVFAFQYCERTFIDTV
jgi:lipopolysaccharide transport system permease protein